MSLVALRYAAKSHGGRESAENAVARINTDYFRSVTGMAKSLTREIKDMERELTASPNEITPRSVESKYNEAVKRAEGKSNAATARFEAEVQRLSRTHGLEEGQIIEMANLDPVIKAADVNMMASIAEMERSKSSMETLIRDPAARSSGQFYFGTVHGRGRCRRSTSFGKYVLSLS